MGANPYESPQTPSEPLPQTQMNRACPNCGSSEFETGWLQDVGSPFNIRYNSKKNTSWLWAWTGLRGTRVAVKRCTRCGRLDLFAND